MLNPNYPICILLSLVFFALAAVYAPKQRFLLAVLCLPGISVLLSYIHLFDHFLVYIQFRSIPAIELSVAFFGFFLGSFVRNKAEIPILIFVLLLLISVPYAKAILHPLKIVRENEWKEDVCLQTTAATCGPASLATIFRQFGINKTEKEIAKESYSCGSGTEIWYLLRYAKRAGLAYQLYHVRGIAELKAASIIGTRLPSGVGHFICFLGHKDDSILIADPLQGRLLLTEFEFKQKYELQGLMFVFEKMK